MNQQEKEQQIGRLTLAQKNLEDQADSYKKTIAKWASDFKTLGRRLADTQRGKFFVKGVKGEEDLAVEDVFVIDDGRSTSVKYPSFDEVSKTLSDLYKAEEKLARIDEELESLGA